MSKGRQGNQSSASWLLNNALFIALFLGAIGLLALLGNRYYWQFDWTLNQRNTLAEASLQLLDRMHGPIHVRAFARESEAVRRGIEELVRSVSPPQVRHHPGILQSRPNSGGDPGR